MPPKLIAFYLPQFHPIPENDAWWGKGFTEWTNVTRATPRFPGHHQPQLPSDLGFYDLRLPETRAAQAELAREYGIHGFCYYHYWFNGKRLLERPFEEILASCEPDFPFCLCWANENWTRRWDGAEREVLIGQNYNDDDDREHIQYLIKAFRDPRYIRVDGKPLILIYRARHLPDPKRSLTIWRNEARKSGVGELFICRVENFFNERDNPHALGFDASVDFQPDWKAIKVDNPSVALPDDHFVIDYRDLVETVLAREEVPHLRFPGVTPAWDNSARRKKNAFIIADSTPEAYEYWLAETLRRIKDRPESQQLVFINAWNEWAEGNHLEPDQKFGRGYLEATRNALQQYQTNANIKPPPLDDTLAYDRFVTQDCYNKWLAKQRLNKPTAALHDARLQSSVPPRIQLILDATQSDNDALSRSLRSISGQLYEHWHLDVLSSQPAPKLSSSRLAWHTIAPDQASGMTATLIAQSDEAWHTLINGGDYLAEDALLFAAQQLLDTPHTALLLTDGDLVGQDGKPQRPWLAPGLNPDWIRSCLCVGGLVIGATRTMLTAMEDIGTSPTNALPIAALLRALEEHGPATPYHIPRISLHRAATHQPIPLEFRADLLQAHLARCGRSAQLKHGLLDDTCHIKYDYGGTQPSIAILIPELTDRVALLRSVESILAKGLGATSALLLAQMPSMPTDLLECLQQLAALNTSYIHIIEIPDCSYAEAANRLADAASTDLILLMDCGLTPLEESWLDNLSRHAMRPEVGAVGGRIVGMDGALHSGVIRLGQMGIAETPHRGISANYTGHGGELQVEQNCSAISSRFLMVRQAVFKQLGGFLFSRYPDQHADIDFCLRLRAQGALIVWTPFSTLISTTPVTTPSVLPPQADDTPLLEDWLSKVSIDPYFNRQLTRHKNRPQLEMDISLAWDPLPWHPVQRVYVHPADFSGCGEVRIATPLRALTRTGAIQGSGSSRFLTPWEIAALAPDSIVIQRPYTDVALEWLGAYRQYSQSLLIYELDDLITRIPPNNASRSSFPADMAARVAKGIGLCDRLVVSTAPLADAYGRYAKEVVVMPNLLDDSIWGNLQPRIVQGSKPRVGWAGSNSHGGDLALIKDVILTLANDVDWIFLGYCPDELRPFLREFHPAVPVKDYPAALANMGLDLAIAPLAANAFNEAKSNLKLLEYGILGYPVVCSNSAAYRGDFPVKRVPNTAKAWIAAIRERIHDLDATRKEGETLQAHIRQHWMLEDHLDEWLTAWTR